MPSSFEINYIE
ncbi:hypothetical protein F383_07818 [Gossypium arboreum]|uniref:Uncharacterized protein n=1 Tax=Gossypium arboreum TaxID=29729 RepID=A0A0B0PMV0_GOSAR|nr:hypothetical protein F383_07818 [Gossypium arboreum]